MKVNTNLLLVEKSLSTLIRKKKTNTKHSIIGIPFTFLFCITTPLHFQLGIHAVFVMAFHIWKYKGKLQRYIITCKLGFTFLNPTPHFLKIIHKGGAIAATASQGKRQLFAAEAITGNHRKSFAKPVKTISAKVLFSTQRWDPCKVFKDGVSRAIVKLRKLSLPNKRCCKCPKKKTLKTFTTKPLISAR